MKNCPTLCLTQFRGRSSFRTHLFRYSVNASPKSSNSSKIKCVENCGLSDTTVCSALKPFFQSQVLCWKVSSGNRSLSLQFLIWIVSFTSKLYLSPSYLYINEKKKKFNIFRRKTMLTTSLTMFWVSLLTWPGTLFKRWAVNYSTLCWKFKITQRYIENSKSK